MANILIVDDDPDVRAMLTLSIEAIGHRVFVAENGQLAMDLFAAHSIDLVVTDIFMPEQEGFETIAILRKQAPTIKIVAISGHRYPNYLGMAMSLGADASLPKPFTSAQLLDVIDGLVGRPLTDQLAGRSLL